MADSSSIFSGAIGAMAAAIALPIILRLAVRPGATVVDGTKVLEYGRPLRILVAVFWVSCAGFFGVAIFAPAKDRVVAVSVFLGYLLMVLALHLEFFVVRIEFDSTGIRTRSPWRPKRDIPWSAVDRAWYSHALNWYVVQTKGFGRVRLHDALGGVESLLTELESRGMPMARRAAG